MAKAFLSKLFKETQTKQLEADRIFQFEELKSGSYKKLKTQSLIGKYEAILIISATSFSYNKTKQNDFLEL